MLMYIYVLCWKVESDKWRVNSFRHQLLMRMQSPLVSIRYVWECHIGREKLFRQDYAETLTEEQWVAGGGGSVDPANWIEFEFFFRSQQSCVYEIIFFISQQSCQFRWQITVKIASTCSFAKFRKQEVMGLWHI